MTGIVEINFSIMYKDEKVADILIRGNRKISIAKYTNEYYKQPFLSSKINLFYIYDFIQSRCYEDQRADLKRILDQAGLTHNDPWSWIKLTHGVTYDDFWWIKFPGETLSWEDVKIR